MSRYLVTVERYSLEPGKVGQTAWGPYVHSWHGSLAAAGRMLGSLISGKLATWYHNKGQGRRLYVFDSETGVRYSRNGCRTGVPLP